MKPEFKKTIDKIKAEAKEPLPRIRFSPEIRTALTDSTDRLDYLEAMTILLDAGDAGSDLIIEFTRHLLRR